MVAPSFAPNHHAELASNRLKLLDPPVSRVVGHGFEQFGGGIHGFYSIACNIIGQVPVADSEITNL